MSSYFNPRNPTGQTPGFGQPGGPIDMQAYIQHINDMMRRRRLMEIQNRRRNTMASVQDQSGQVARAMRPREGGY